MGSNDRVQQIKAYKQQVADELTRELDAHTARELQKLEANAARRLKKGGRSDACQADIEASSRSLLEQAHRQLEQIRRDTIQRIQDIVDMPL